MTWDERAELVLAMLCRMVPETLRELAGAAARDESEAVAAGRDATEVSEDDVVRGWIRITPPEQRNGMVAVIDSLGLDPSVYASELEDAQGWDEEPSENA